ncbi:LINE-1 reverse transcriptase homolog [Elysia marginata]|uniref:LINE-1 reverse transcriptase homolog n=1 Tax=Elysia marginata TaxID=1093978 RepID=A0AAV4F200_9GAST|nr:LINE-1 reverse transcriptase homolog [Elysia marginata]
MGEDQCASQIAEKKEELENLRAQIMKCVLIRSKARWINEGEKVSRYFCNLENRHYTSKRMNSLINEKGEEIKDNELITNEVKQYYEHLYKSQEGKIEDIDLNLELLANTPKLTDEEAISIEGPISLEEATNVLKHMKYNKSPGSEGFIVEFYKFFWTDLGHFMAQSLRHSFDNNMLSITQREGLITCIPKQGKCKQQIKTGDPLPS